MNALLSLTTTQRAQTLVALDTAFMATNPDKVEFVVTAILKTSKPNKDPLPLTIRCFPETVSLCPYVTLQEYLKRTQSARVAANTTKLLLSFIKPHISVFKGHSYQSAATSKAISQGVSVDLILKTADWSTESVFTRFYRRDSTAYEQCFSRVVLTS